MFLFAETAETIRAEKECDLELAVRGFVLVTPPNVAQIRCCGVAGRWALRQLG